jgi:ABC-type spermidine/putrescine transport system permease subunit I
MKMKKFLKFWWEYNKKKYNDDNMLTSPSFIWYICLFFVAIGFIIAFIFSGFYEGIKDWNSERKKFWKEYKTLK